MNGIQKTASDGKLMATFRDYFYRTHLNMASQASLITSVVFESKAAFKTIH